MYNRRLEYNPLFESLSETAKRYQRIDEDAVDSDYKKKAAVDYAKRLLEITWGQLGYFIEAIPNPELKAKIKAQLLDFSKQITLRTDLTVDELINVVTEKWKAFKDDITRAKEVEAYATKLQEVYDKVSQAMDKMVSATKIYLEKYPDESRSNEVITVVANMLAKIKTSFEQNK